MSRERREIRSFGAGREVVSVGLSSNPWTDVYHRLLTMSWPRFFGLLFAAFLVVNGLFAAGYASLGDGIESARPGSLADSFFFSVQTLATIGYGKMAPRSTAANLLVSVEALVGMIGLAVTTGVVYGRFARPTARVLFSDAAVIRPWDGVPSLMFRMANARGNLIAEARVKVTFLREERTAEGETVRRVHDLELLRSESAAFALTWTIVHPIAGKSPLVGETPESLREKRADIMVSLTGLDEGLSQTIHARHGYAAEKLAWNAKLADILTTRPDGIRVIDYRRFHALEPLGPPGSGNPAPSPVKGKGQAAGGAQGPGILDRPAGPIV
jgi:inward rectifier potassium channel